jgi:hypothetical protein
MLKSTPGGPKDGYKKRDQRDKTGTQNRDSERDQPICEYFASRH